MIVEGQSYSFVRASDVDRDGVTIECWKGYGESGDQGTLVAEAVWHDPTGKFTIRMHERELPFVLMDALLREAASWCPPTKRTEPTTRTLIYVPLLDEGVQVWRPVTAELVDGSLYRILGENTSPDHERWAFVTGDIVHCEPHRFDDGSTGYVATRTAG
jgi:hypothetical protein